MQPLLFVLFIVALVIGLRLARRELLRRKQRLVLPLTYHPLTKAGSVKWGWEVSRASAGLWTTAFNSWPLSVASSFGSRLRRFLRGVYNAGAWLGVLGIITGAGGLLLATADVWFSVVTSLQTVTDEGIIDVSPASARPFLEPIIPGLTRPLSHLPVLVLAVLVNQGIHEAGHALSAAIDGIAPSSVSLSVVGFFMPMAAVSFDEDDLDFMDRKATMRLAAAGPLHNFVTWAFMALLLSTSLGRFGLEDVSARGLYVSNVKQGSELVDHLPGYALITKLDATPVRAIDLWDDYLHGSANVTQVTWENLDNALEGGVVTWEGARHAIWEDVAVSVHAPLRPRGLFSLIRLYVEYFVGIALSLALLNLLPFPHSDGSQLLSSLLESPHDDLESGKTKMHRGRRTVKMFEYTTVVIGACFALGQGALGIVS